MKLLACTLLFLFMSLAKAQSITVSGLSSGAYMAQQFHTAYSSSVRGVGIIAGGPYYCAKNSPLLAIKNCMETRWGVPKVTDSFNVANVLANSGLIDSLKNMKKSKAYILSGTKDETVTPQVVESVKELYLLWGMKKDNLKYIDDLPVGHAFPTMDFGNDCSESKSPFIGNCQRDVAGEILNHLIGPLKKKKSAKRNRLFKFNQLSFVSPIKSPRLSMNSEGFLYLPAGCENPKKANCPIHIAFHGCLQSFEDIGLEFIWKAGYNDWAEANRVVILYPQTIKNSLIGNPNSCWDWWGYTNPYYHTKWGAQVRTVWAIVNHLSQGILPLRLVE